MDKKNEKKKNKKLELNSETLKNLTVKSAIRAGNYTQQAGCTSAPMRYTHCNTI